MSAVKKDLQRMSELLEQAREQIKKAAGVIEKLRAQIIRLGAVPEE